VGLAVVRGHGVGASVSNTFNAGGGTKRLPRWFQDKRVKIGLFPLSVEIVTPMSMIGWLFGRVMDALSLLPTAEGVWLLVSLAYLIS
jgi:hypothetical protein